MPTDEKFYYGLLDTSALALVWILDASPCVSLGKCSINAKVILGASFGLAGMPAVLPAVKVVSSAASTDTILIVMTVAEAMAAFNFADISTVLEV